MSWQQGKDLGLHQSLGSLVCVSKIRIDVGDFAVASIPSSLVGEGGF